MTTALHDVNRSEEHLLFSEEVPEATINGLVDDCVAQIFKHLSFQKLQLTSLVDRRWHRLSAEPIAYYKARHSILCEFKDQFKVPFGVKLQLAFKEFTFKSIIDYLHLPDDIWAKTLLENMVSYLDFSVKAHKPPLFNPPISELANKFKKKFDPNIAKGLNELAVSYIKKGYFKHDNYNLVIDLNNPYWKGIMETGIKTLFHYAQNFDFCEVKGTFIMSPCVLDQDHTKMDGIIGYDIHHRLTRCLSKLKLTICDSLIPQDYNEFMLRLEERKDADQFLHRFTLPGTECVILNIPSEMDFVGFLPLGLLENCKDLEMLTIHTFSSGLSTTALKQLAMFIARREDKVEHRRLTSIVLGVGPYKYDHFAVFLKLMNALKNPPDVIIEAFRDVQSEDLALIRKNFPNLKVTFGY